MNHTRKVQPRRASASDSKRQKCSRYGVGMFVTSTTSRVRVNRVPATWPSAFPLNCGDGTSILVTRPGRDKAAEHLTDGLRRRSIAGQNPGYGAVQRIRLVLEHIAR